MYLCSSSSSSSPSSPPSTSSSTSSSSSSPSPPNTSPINSQNPQTPSIPHTPSHNTPPPPISINSILQLNCNGIQNSHSEIASLLHNKNILIAAIQETKLTPSSNLRPFPNFTTLRRDRPGGTRGGGLIILIHHSISFTPLPTDHLFPNDSTIEHLAISATINSLPINIYNIYIPPISSCPPNYTPDLEALLSPQDDSIVLGDFNAHSPAWFSQTSDTRAAARGQSILDSLTSSNLVLLNSDSPTRLPSSGNPSSPDLTIVTPEIVPDLEWSTITTLNSDHLPILIHLHGSFSSDSPDPPRQTFDNFRKADWISFTRETERAFTQLGRPTSCSTGEIQFRRILLSSARHFIPKGHIPNHIPDLPDSTKQLIRQRDSLRSTNPTHPHIHDLDLQITKDISDSNRKKWIHTVETCSHKHNTSRFWNLLKSLSSKETRTAPNQPITFNHTTLSTPRTIATAFNRQFTSIVPHSSDPTARRVKRKLVKLHPLDTNLSLFTVHSVSRAIRDSGNSRAPGPDGLTIHHLKHLGPLGLQYLTDLYNLSIQHSDIPSIWKTSTIVPIPKPGKPLDLGPSYRPISLLSPAIKVLERLLLPQLNTLPLSPTQHGFRTRHNTTTALIPLTHVVASGFNQPRPPHRTLTMAIDFSRAFDMVNHTKLITSLTQTTLPHNTVRWLSAYLRGRMARCRYLNTTSPHRHAHVGVPQGSCISPVLFNFFVSSYPSSPDFSSTSYADDFTDSYTSPDIPTAASALSAHARLVADWADERGLAVSYPKSTITLFTSDNQQSHIHPHVLLRDSRLPLDRNPRILGVTFDPHFNFSKHVSSLISRITPRLNIIRALAGTSWGQQRETILITFKSLIRSIVTYAAPIWYPNASPSNIQKLQSLQNSALRIATGCVKMTDPHHLHTETQTLPVSDHLSLLCAQFLSRTLIPSHPSHLFTSAPSGPRNIRHTLQSKFLPTVAPYLTNGTLPPDQYKPTLQALHTSAVRSAIDSRNPNRVLLAHPPPVSDEELSLPRIYRTTLSQLRSGFCPALKTYLARVGRAPDDLCPSCRGSPQTPSHLFSCPSHPTPLKVEDLWSRPVRASLFLSSLPFFNLPPLARPPPEPPPSPPPVES